MKQSKAIQEALRQLPSIDEIIISEKINNYSLPRTLIKNIIQDTIHGLRQDIINNIISKSIIDTIKNSVIQQLDQILDFSIKPIINGTGIVLHTGFGRAPISAKIINKSTKILLSYSSLEFDVKNAIRGERLQFSKILLNNLLKSEDSLVVNNCAAAVFITLNTISLDKEVIISRGQQVEIGGSFRIPEVIKKSGSKMVEVGTTNRTHLKDYKNAISDNTGAILIVHPSNYKVIGFTKDVDLRDLISFAKEKNIPIILDLGSGMLLNNSDITNDPIVKDYIDLGFDLVMFSADKLLGGPQAGIVCGNRDLISQIHHNPIYRSLRCNKFILSILEQTLSQYKTDEDVLKNNLALSLLNQNQDDLLDKGKDILNNVDKKIIKEYNILLVESVVEVGSGSLPTEKKPSIAIQFSNTKISANRLSKQFRVLSPAVIGYINNNYFYIDLKAILKNDIQILSNSINKIFK